MRRLLHERRGQAMVEMALILPVLIWLLIGLVDIARMASAYVLIQQGSREGVRLGITGAADSAVVARATLTTSTLDQSRLTVTVTPTGTRASGTDVVVSVHYSYKVLALMGIIGTDVPLDATLIGRVE